MNILISHIIYAFYSCNWYITISVLHSLYMALFFCTICISSCLCQMNNNVFLLNDEWLKVACLIKLYYTETVLALLHSKQISPIPYSKLYIGLHYKKKMTNEILGSTFKMFLCPMVLKGHGDMSHNTCGHTTGWTQYCCAPIQKHFNAAVHLHRLYGEMSTEFCKYNRSAYTFTAPLRSV